MGRPKRQYPVGHYRLRLPKEPKEDQAYPIEIEYTWNRKIIRRTTNVFTKEANWNPKGNYGRGELRSTYGENYRHVNSILAQRLNQTDSALLEYNFKHPGQITEYIICCILDNKPINRLDQGRDFVDFAISRVETDYLHKRIGKSRYQNELCSLRIFSEFLDSANIDSISGKQTMFVGDICVEIVEKYIVWRKTVKKNCDDTINHALTPILRACEFASKNGWLASTVNARIQDLKISKRVKLSDDDSSTAGRYLSEEQLNKLIEYYTSCNQSRKRQYLEIFLFSFHACGLRVIDIMTLQWSHINFERSELRKILIKTSKRHVIPLSPHAIDILKKWKAKGTKSKYVFGLLPDTVNLDNDTELYKYRNNITKCINQSLSAIGKKLDIPVKLTMHCARHTFAVMALNKGMAMSVVSRLLGHSSTTITEKVYAKYLPETLASEMNRLKEEFSKFSI